MLGGTETGTIDFGLFFFLAMQAARGAGLLRKLGEQGSARGHRSIRRIWTPGANHMLVGFEKNSNFLQ